MKRSISEVRVVPLHGTAVACASVQAAIDFVTRYEEGTSCGPLLKYEVQVRYRNGDKVDAQFHDKAAVVEFLEHYRTGNWTPVAEGEETEG